MQLGPIWTATAFKSGSRPIKTAWEDTLPGLFIHELTAGQTQRNELVGHCKRSGLQRKKPAAVAGDSEGLPADCAGAARKGFTAGLEGKMLDIPYLTQARCVLARHAAHPTS